MVQKSLSQQAQSEPPSPPPDGNSAPPNRVLLTNAEWDEATDIDMAFHAAVDCEVEVQHRLELIKSVQVRYAQFIGRVSNRLHPDD